MQNTLSKYVSTEASEELKELLNKNEFILKIVKNRSSKHGDFRVLKNGSYQITINNDLNKYRFLITLLHEIAHLITFKNNRNVKPHGVEWKNNFQKIMLPFLVPSIFPDEILALLAKYLLNPKASTDTDYDLNLSLKKQDAKTENEFIYELNDGCEFIFKGREFTKVEKRRKRYVCIENASKKVYLFNALAEVNKVKK